MQYVVRISLLTLLVLVSVSAGYAEIRVVTTTTDLAHFVEEIGGGQVTVDAINRGDRDPHFVEVRPSYMLKVRRADLLFMIGMELEMWVDPLVDGSRNGDLTIVDCSERIEPMEVPSFKVDASHGDIHPHGNPHYWLGPDNVPAIIETIVDALTSFDPGHVDTYRRNADAYLERLDSAKEEWQQYASQLKGKKLVFYHNSWPYFADYFGIEVVEHVEPKPGIHPSPGHIQKLQKLLAAGEIQAIAVEPYFDHNIPEMLSEKSGVPVVNVCPSIGGVPGVESYPQMIEYNLRVLAGE